MIYYLYLITRADGERYVGVTKHPDRRAWEHKNGYGSTNLKGWEFQFEVLHEGSEPSMYALEDAAIKAYQCSLNKIIGGKFGHGLVGSTNGRAKLTEADVLMIKHLVADKVPQKEIANRFNVSRQTVGGIATGVNWKHVEGPITTACIRVPENLRCQLRDMKRAGMSCADISRKTNIKYATVYSHVRDIH